MYKFTLFLVAILVAIDIAGAAECRSWPGTVYLLRHAEKQDKSTNSPLSAAGWQRAGGLVSALTDADIAAIFVTDKRRTQQTAMPLSVHTGVDSKIFPQTEISQLVAALCGFTATEAVVVVGHTSTIPKVMSAIEVSPAKPKFGDLFVVDMTQRTVRKDRYGDCR